jgi:hypothetical protein
MRPSESTSALRCASALRSSRKSPTVVWVEEMSMECTVTSPVALSVTLTCSVPVCAGNGSPPLDKSSSVSFPSLSTSWITLAPVREPNGPPAGIPVLCTRLNSRIRFFASASSSELSSGIISFESARRPPSLPPLIGT